MTGSYQVKVLFSFGLLLTDGLKTELFNQKCHDAFMSCKLIGIYSVAVE